jgi:hypothetical protein
MTAFQDLQATGWRDVAIGEIPEFIVYRNPQGTFTRSVTAALVIVIMIEFLIRGKTSLGVPYYGMASYANQIWVWQYATHRKNFHSKTPNGQAQAHASPLYCCSDLYRSNSCKWEKVLIVLFHQFADPFCQSIVVLPEASPLRTNSSYCTHLKLKLMRHGLNC